MPFGKGPQGRDVDDDLGRLVEGADQVLALRQVHGCLAADRRVDLGDEGRRDVDDRDAAQVRGREEPGGVTQGTSADGHDGLIATHAQAGEFACGLLHDGKLLGVLALRQHDGLHGQTARCQPVREAAPTASQAPGSDTMTARRASTARGRRAWPTRRSLRRGSVARSA